MGAPRNTAYNALAASFRWAIPERFNIGVATVDRWAIAEPDGVALLRFDPAGGLLMPTTYGALKDASDRLAMALRLRGIGRGDRVAILLPQSPETVIGHTAAYKLGAIVVPLAALFGPDALRYRLEHSGARAILTDAAGISRLVAMGDRPAGLDVVISIDGTDGTVEGLAELLARPPGDFIPEVTAADDPALMIYTSGTTGPPKGALHGHRVLLGHLPGFAYTHAPFPSPGDRLWTPSDWAWAGGLLNALLPALHAGIAVVYGPFRRFDPEAAFALMAEARVRNVFLPPTALRLMRSVADPRSRFDLDLRSVGAAGESLGRETCLWAPEGLGVPANEFYGQTECNYVIGSSAEYGVARPGAIGKAIPGHTVAIIGGDGRPLPFDEIGEIAIRRPDPVMFLGYWQDEEATRGKFIGDWLTTGDQAYADPDGYIHFVGRNDEVITSAGYRIGPGEVEDCLLAHPAVAMAAVVGKPDPLRTEIVKAFVVVKPGYAASPGLADDIKRFVRERLSAAEYPREIAFVADVPLTTSGKVIRREFRERVLAEAEAEDAG